jgi:hypothetical protein
MPKNEQGGELLFWETRFMRHRRTCFTLFTLIAITFAFTTTLRAGAGSVKHEQDTAIRQLDPLFNAMATVESHHNPAAIGDNGEAIGTFQIHYDYWKDSNTPGAYADVRNTAYAKLVMYNYWKRYCPDALSNLNFEQLAKTHQGGPSGASRPAAATYWTKVQRNMRI